jgi:hypothetical protein
MKHLNEQDLIEVENHYHQMGGGQITGVEIMEH